MCLLLPCRFLNESYEPFPRLFYHVVVISFRSVSSGVGSNPTLFPPFYRLFYIEVSSHYYNVFLPRLFICFPILRSVFRGLLLLLPRVVCGCCESTTLLFLRGVH